MADSASVAPEPDRHGGRASSLTVNVLGPLEVLVDGAPAALSRLQLRQTVMLLAATANQPVPAARLTAGLWPRELPKDPARAQRVVLSRLRSALGSAAEALEVADRGVTLFADTDLAEFGTLLDAAEAASGFERSALLEQALKLWRGRPFVEIEEASFAEQLNSTLLERRSRAVTDLAGTYVEGGQYGAAIGVARPVHLEEPHRTPLALVLAQAYALNGQKADALQTIESARSALRSGTQPPEALDRLEQGILSGAIEFEQPVHDEAVAVAPLRLVGRERELDALGAASTMTTVVVGEPGIGKSTLLHRAIQRLEESGHLVYRTSASPNPERPLEPIADLLQRASRDVPHLGQDARFDAVFARLVPGHRPNSTRSASPNREELLAAATEALVQAAAEGPLVLAIDDCHLLDRSSAAVLEQLVHRDACRVLVASRRTGAPHLDFLLAGDNDRVEVIDLPPLSVEEVGVFVADTLPATRAPVAAELHARTGGNPLFLHLLADLLESSDDERGLDLPSSVLVAVQTRLEALSQRTIETLQWASALGATFSRSALRELCSNADEDLTLAEAEGLVEISSGDDAHFRHVVVMEATYQLIADAQKVTFHDEISHLLQDLGAAPAEYAIHCGRAASFDPIRAVRAHLDAAIDFADAFAWDLVDRHLRFARQHHEAHAPHAEELDAELTVWQGILERATGQADARQTLVRAARRAWRVGAVPAFVLAVLELCDTGPVARAESIDDDLAELLDDALGLELDAGTRAELCARASNVYLPAGLTDRARTLYGEAEQIADELHDPVLEAKILVRSHFGLAHPDDADRRARAGSRLTELAGVDPELTWEAAFLQYGVGLCSANRALVDDSLHTLRGVTPKLVRRDCHFGLAFCEAAYSMLTGDLEQAEALLSPVLEHGLAIYTENRVMTVYGAQVLAIRLRQGRAPHLQPLLSRLMVTRPGFATWDAAAAHLAAEVGDAAAVESALAGLRPNGFDAIVKDLSWTAVASLLVQPIAVAGTPADAGTIYDQLLPHSGRMTWTGTTTFGPVDHYLAELARMTGDTRRAESHDARAREVLTGMGLDPQWHR